MICRFLYLLISFLLVYEVKTCFQRLHLEALVKTFPSRSNYGSLCPLSSLTMTSSNTQTSSSTITSTPSSSMTSSSSPTATATSTPTKTSSSSQTKTPTQTSTQTPSKTVTSTETSTETTTSSQTQTPSQTPSNSPTTSVTPTKTRTNSPTSTKSSTKSRSMSPSQTATPSEKRIQIVFQGNVGVGSSWTRSATPVESTGFSFRFLIPPSTFIGPNISYWTENGATISTTFLQNFSFNDILLLYERDINCGNAPDEPQCSCSYNCGQINQFPCCRNFHRPIIKEIDGDGLPSTSFSPWSIKGQGPAYSLSLECNNASIPHIWIAIRGNNTIHYTSPETGRIIGLSNFQNDFTRLKPFAPSDAIGADNFGHTYCLPNYSEFPEKKEIYKSISHNSSCLRAGFCAATTSSAIPTSVQAYGGCFCDITCNSTFDCCNDAINCYFQSGSELVSAGNLFADNCVPGLFDCTGVTCFFKWVDKIIGDGICDDGRRGVDLNCQSNDNLFSFDSGDCYCEPPQVMTCSGKCGDPLTSKLTNCQCSDIENSFIDCDGACAPYVFDLICFGIKNFNFDCPNVLALFNATTLEEATDLYCPPLKVSDCVVSIPSYWGDAVCDIGIYNTASCSYDGGDCCASTCIENSLESTFCPDLDSDTCLDPGAIENNQKK